MKITFLAIFGLFVLAIGVSYAYGFEETVQIPSGDYNYKNSYAIIWSTEDWEFIINYGYGENLIITYPRNGDVIPLDPTADDPIQDLIDKVEKILGEKEKSADDGLGIDDSITTDLKKTEAEPASSRKGGQGTAKVSRWIGAGLCHDC